MTEKQPEIWGNFWRTAGAHGCTEAFPPSARAAIAEQWRVFFRAHAGARSALDIASGRGAVLLHAAESGLRGALTGVDLAPAEALGSAPFTLRGGIDAATLPFADRAFDLVTSQFGIEYADLPRAVAEAARVCAGTLRFLSHASTSIVVRHAAQQAAQCEWLLAPSGVAARLADVANAPSDAAAAALAQAIGDARERAANDENSWIVDSFCESVEQIRDGTAGLPRGERVAYAAYAADQLAEHRLRMAALAGAALDADAAATIAAQLEGEGFDAAVSDCLGPDGVLIGRWIDGRRTR